MITATVTEAWKCSECGWLWLRDRGKEGVPARCPNRKCRKTATYGRTAPVVNEDVAATHKHLMKQSVWLKPMRPAHNQRTCMVYGCAMCRLAIDNNKGTNLTTDLLSKPYKR